MNLIAKILGREKDEQLTPKIGEQWILSREHEGPWVSTNKYPPVEVLDVKDGWVRYKMSDKIFQDERMKTNIFVKVYKRCESPTA